jgi:hypothetical protein
MILTKRGRIVSDDAMSCSATPLFTSPPPWWWVLVVINVVLFIPTCMNEAYYREQDREAGYQHASLLKPTQRVPKAFSISLARGFEELSYALSNVAGTFILAATPALLMFLATAIMRRWLQCRTWLLCFALTLFVGFVVMYVTGT